MDTNKDMQNIKDIIQKMRSDDEKFYNETKKALVEMQEKTNKAIQNLQECIKIIKGEAI